MTTLIYPKAPHPSIEGYIEGSLEGLKSNANRARSYADLRVMLANEAISSFTMDSYPREITKLHDSGYIYIHDRSDGIVPYCHGADLYKLLGSGLWTTHIVSGPPKHFSSALNQAVNYLNSTQKEFSGAQAFADFNTLLAPLINRDGLSRTQVKQFLQEMFFNLNSPVRGPETAFTNVMLNVTTPEYWSDKMVCSPGLSEHRYGDFLDESLLILECMDEIYGEGDYAGNPFTFPIPTINLTPDITFNEPIWDNILRTTSKYGSYYFMNYRGSGIKSGSKRNMCCRVMLDYDELSSTGGRWAMESSTGSLGIVTLNMARLGYVCRDSNGLLDNLTYLMNRAVESLTIKAGWIRRLQEAGMLPLISRYDIHMERFFYTIGVLGFDELFMNLNGTHIWDNMDQATEILNHMRDWTRERQRELGVLINIEMTPGEEAASKLASRDVEQYPDMYHQGTDEAPYYSTLLTPPSYYMGVMERARIEERLLPLFTGGTVHRIYMGEGQPYHEGLKKITQRIADNTKIPYFDFTATFSVCQSCHGFMPGPHVTCSRCGATNRIYSRITGYYRDMLNSNLGKQQEFWDRKYVSI